MNLLTLNCHSWQEENQLDKIKHLAEVIKEKSYDVIALQEVSQSLNAQIVSGHIKKDNFVHVLLEELEKLGVVDYQYTWDVSHLGYEVYEEGLAILTKHPIIETNSFFVSNSKDPENWKTRKIVGAKISYQNKPISFYSCHLGWWHDEEEPFKNQADNLLDFVQKDERFFLMGDFNNNSFIKGEGYDYLVDQGLIDTYNLAEKRDQGITVKGKIAGWDKNKRDLRIDLILTNQLFRIKSSNVIFNGVSKTIISDHLGVEIEVMIGNESV